jgi:hypothetical protein
LRIRTDHRILRYTKTATGSAEPRVDLRSVTVSIILSDESAYSLVEVEGKDPWEVSRSREAVSTSVTPSGFHAALVTMLSDQPAEYPIRLVISSGVATPAPPMTSVLLVFSSRWWM